MELSSNGDFGTGSAWYLWECFSYAVTHATGKPSVRNASHPLHSVPAIFVFDIPKSQLESMPHLVIPDHAAAKALIFSSRHLSSQIDNSTTKNQWDSSVTKDEMTRVLQQLVQMYPSLARNSGPIQSRLILATLFVVKQLNDTNWIFSYKLSWSDQKGTPFSSMRFFEDCQQGSACACDEEDQKQTHKFRTASSDGESAIRDPPPTKRWATLKGLTASANRQPIGQLVLKSDKAFDLLGSSLCAVLFLGVPRGLDDGASLADDTGD
jgi:hypothetical protein